MQCQHCGKCCNDKKISINLSVGDIWRICSFLKISIDEFFKRYGGIKKFKDPRDLKEEDDLGLNMPCKFRKNGECSIYSARPVNCRIFPYWVFALIPERDIKRLLKDYECKYNLKNKKTYKKYQEAIANILLEEAKWFDVDNEFSISKVKEAIGYNLYKIGIHNKELEKAEKIIK